MKRKNFEKKQYSQEDIQNIKFRDLVGIATPQELEILQELGIGSFMLHTVDTSGFFPKNLDPKICEYHEKCAERWRKKK